MEGLRRDVSTPLLLLLCLLVWRLSRKALPTGNPHLCFCPPACLFHTPSHACSCAFGHTCKFHHPELPPGGGAAPPLPPMYAMQYAMQYQSSSPPMLASVLGLKPGSSGGPGTPLAAQHGGAAPAGYYVTSPHFPGQLAYPPSWPPASSAGGPAHRHY